jgi:hypothetical protein
MSNRQAYRELRCSYRHNMRMASLMWRKLKGRHGRAREADYWLKCAVSWREALRNL